MNKKEILSSAVVEYVLYENYDDVVKNVCETDEERDFLSQHEDDVVRIYNEVYELIDREVEKLL